MPTVTLKKDVLEKLMGKKLPLDQLKDRISMIGTDLEKIEGNDIVVEVFPNRPDMLSEPGFARALSAFIGVKPGLRNYAVKKSGCKVIVDKSVSMRQYTACAIVKKLRFDDERLREIIQLQEKLATTHGRNRKKSAYGLYPLKQINFPIRYIAKDPATVMFTPLGFDKPIKASLVEQLHPKGKEYSHVAKGWAKYPFFIDAKDNVMCMLPYTNSNDTGKIDLSTKEVFVECTGNDFANVSAALNIIVTTLADLGGEIFSLDIQYPDKTIVTPNLSPRELKVDFSYVNKMIGLELKETETKKLLERMGMSYAKGKVLIPSYRTDILHQMDIAEDIAIAYGYENFEPQIPNVMTLGEEDAFEVFKNRVASIISGLGLLETISYNLTNKENNNTKMLHESSCVELENSQTADRTVLRSWVLPNLMQVLSENTSKEYPQEIFEIGTAFSLDAKIDSGVAESTKLSVSLARIDSDFTKIRQIIDVLMKSLDVDFSLEKSSMKTFIPGRQGKIIVNKVEIGFIGEVHPQVLSNFSVQMPVSSLELDLGKIYELVSKK